MLSRVGFCCPELCFWGVKLILYSSMVHPRALYMNLKCHLTWDTWDYFGRLLFLINILIKPIAVEPGPSVDSDT